MHLLTAPTTDNPLTTGEEKLKRNIMVVFITILIALGFAALLYYGARIGR